MKNNMEDFITYKQAIKLKELGFDWKCIGYYTCLGNFGINHIMEYTLDSKIICDNYNDNTISQTYNVEFSAPTLSQTQKWLREVKDIIIGIDFDNWNDKYECHVYKRMGYKGANIRDTYGSQLVTNKYHEDFDTYEQALSAGIDKALEFLKEKRK